MKRSLTIEIIRINIQYVNGNVLQSSVYLLQKEFVSGPTPAQSRNSSKRQDDLLWRCLNLKCSLHHQTAERAGAVSLPQER